MQWRISIFIRIKAVLSFERRDVALTLGIEEIGMKRTRNSSGEEETD